MLALVYGYREFMKGTIDATAREVSNVTVMVHHNRLSEVSRYIPLGGYLSHVRIFTLDRLVDESDKPENVTTKVISLLYFTPDGRNIHLGDDLFRRADDLIQRSAVKFDIIQAHFTWPCGYAAVKLGQKYGVPVVVVLHEEMDQVSQMASSPNPRFRWTWMNASGLVRVNKRDIPLLGLYNKEVVFATVGYNPKDFFPMPKEIARNAIGLSRNAKVIFALGYLDKRKGFRFLVQAIRDLEKASPNLICIIGGTGPMRHDLESGAKALGLAKNISFPGYIPREKLNYYYNAADLVVHPSLSENGPTVMYESLACGVPFIGTVVGAIPMVISSDEYGLLARTGDSKDLAQKIGQGLEKSWDREKIHSYSQQYTWDRVVKPILELQQRLVTQRVASK